MEYHRHEAWDKVGKKVKAKRDNWAGLDPEHKMYEDYSATVSPAFRASLEPHLGEIRKVGMALGTTQIFSDGTTDYVRHLKYIFKHTVLMKRRHIAGQLLDEVKLNN